MPDLPRKSIPELVDLIQNEDWVLGLSASKSLNDLPGQRTDIGSRRCPRISASSRMPPSDTRTNFRSSEVATDLANDVLPTPGGPTKHKYRPLHVGV